MDGDAFVGRAAPAVDGRACSVVVPWRSGCPHRLASWRWLRPKWEALGFEVVEGVHDEGPWCKALAVADGIRKATGSVLVLADADVWCDQTPDAVARCLDGVAWAVPHSLVHRLTHDATLDVIRGLPLTRRSFRRDSLEEGSYRAHLGGGITVIRRDAYEQVPLDPRFRSWGHEDDAWALALAALIGPAWQSTAPLWHLWHPPQPRLSRDVGSEASAALFARYQTADPEGLRRLIEEAREATCPSAPMT